MMRYSRTLALLLALTFVFSSQGFRLRHTAGQNVAESYGSEESFSEGDREDDREEPEAEARAAEESSFIEDEEGIGEEEDDDQNNDGRSFVQGEQDDSAFGEEPSEEDHEMVDAEDEDSDDDSAEEAMDDEVQEDGSLVHVESSIRKSTVARISGTGRGCEKCGGETCCRPKRCVSLGMSDWDMACIRR